MSVNYENARGLDAAGVSARIYVGDHIEEKSEKKKDAGKVQSKQKQHTKKKKDEK